MLRRTKSDDDADIDAAIDELFGDVTDENPGRFDLALLAIGAGLIAWWVIAGTSGPGLVLGIISIVLGLALPARNALRAVDRRWAGVKDERAMGAGYPLDIGDGSIAALVNAYSRVIRVAEGSRVPRADEAADTAHRAVVEVASLLGTGRPTAEADASYVRERTRAINALASSLSAANDRHLGAARLGDRGRQQPNDTMRGAVAKARDELDASSGLGSVADLDALAQQFDGEAGHARRR